MTAIIETVEITAGHDGRAEMVVCLVYENGGRSSITLDETAGARLMQSCNANNLTDLSGQSWDRVRDALVHAYNRYQS